MKLILKLTTLSLVLVAITSSSSAQVTEKKTLTIDGAKKVIAASVAYASL
jgi:ABC-type phosphate transport system substrate-binding protein